ncbi:PDZ domain-containing protein [soil metagenome]
MILKFRQIRVLAFAFALSFFMFQESPAMAQDTNIGYKVSMRMPWTHLLEVEMRLRPNRMPSTTELKMAVWTPGSYLIREYARHVQDFTVKDTDGRALKWEKVNKNTWKIDSKGVKEIVATYRVYSNELTVRTNELNSEHAFWNNAALLMYPAGQINAPSTIEVIPFGNWKVATGLPVVAGRKNTYRAPNFDILFDSPFEVSDFKEKKFMVGNVPHRLVVTGEGNYDLDQIAIDTAKIGDEAVKIFGDLPTKDYLIILNLRGRGGLEHLNSTALQWNRFGFKPRSQYIAFLNLVAHEYFHLWNVKRIRPDALGPFDYENENYTKLLWVAEGTTAYYEGVLLRRAGLVTDKEILETKASLIGQLQNRPGRFQTSLEESSVDAWIKYYRQDQNAINNQISYYDKGEIVNMMLDIRIRTLSNGTRSLDDVMRYLYDEFYKKNRNFTPSDFQAVCERMAGQRLNDFFASYVSGRDEIDYDSILGGVGLRLKVERENEKRGYLGADIADSNGVLTVRTVPAGSPAYEQGLNFNDQIVAIDGYKASNTFLNSYIGNKRPGDSVKLTVFRFDRLEELVIRLGSDARGDYSIVPVDSPSATQQKLYRGYMDTDLD